MLPASLPAVPAETRQPVGAPATAVAYFGQPHALRGFQAREKPGCLILEVRPLPLTGQRETEG